MADECKKTREDSTPCYLRDGKSALFVIHCKSCEKVYTDILREQTIKTLEWMIADMKWRADETKLNLEEGSQGGYSSELQEAINLLARWKELSEDGTL